MLIRYGDDLYRFCLHIMRKKETADDLYQDTVLKAFEKAEVIEKSGNPRAYLFSVAAKLAHNYFRKEKRRGVSISVDEENFDIADLSGNVAENSEKRQLYEAVRRAVMELDEKYRVPLVLYYFDEKGIEFISDVMAIPKGTVKSRLFKARELLEKKLKKGGFADE